MSVIHITLKDKVQTIALPEIFNTQVVQEFEAESKTWLLGEANLYVLDFKKVSSLSKNEYRVLLSFCTTAAKVDKKVVSVHVSSALLKQLKKDGVDSLMNIFEIKKEA
jgi:anti-anti-sigma regulatory factor